MKNFIQNKKQKDNIRVTSRADSMGDMSACFFILKNTFLSAALAIP